MNMQDEISKQESLKNELFNKAKKTKEYKFYLFIEILKAPFLFLSAYAKYFSILFSISFSFLVIVSLNITPQSIDLGDFREVVVIASMPAFIFSLLFALKVFFERKNVYLKEADEIARSQVDIINNIDLVNDLIDKKLERYLSLYDTKH